jgi:hypothetical protein
MATGLDGFAAHLKQIEENAGEFHAQPYYEPETDSLIFYIRDESAYSKRVTKYFTVFLSNEDDSLVGIEVKGLKVISRAIEDLGEVDLIDPLLVKAEDGESHALSVIVRCALVPEPDEPVTGDQYEQLKKATHGIRVNKPKACGA